MVTKKEIKELIIQKKYNQLIELADKKHSQTLKFIQMNLFGGYNQPLRWYSIEALGKLANNLAPQEPEIYRNLIRRFLWAMNDESGNVPWSSPEAIGSIIANQPFLFGDYTPMLITNALDNPMCHRGLAWAVGRIGRVNASLVEPFIEKILPFLDTDDADLVGLTTWALGAMGYQEAKPKLLKVAEKEDRIITIFRNGNLVQDSISNLAKEAIENLELAS